RNATAMTASSDTSVSLIGVSVVNLQSATNGTIAAHIDDGATLIAGSLSLSAGGSSTPTASASAVGVKLVSASGIVTGASDTTNVYAYVGPSEGNNAADPMHPTTVTTTGSGVT